MKPSEKSMEKARAIVSGMMFSDVYEVGPNREPVNIRDKHAEEIAAALSSAIAETREEMAKLAENAEDDRGKADSPYDGGSGSLGYAEACRDIAAAIRATGKESER